jgi:pyruvate dehydrogenase E2 component (dihydrolipoamide acetyltransferase)
MIEPGSATTLTEDLTPGPTESSPLNEPSRPVQRTPPDELVAELQAIGIEPGSYRFQPLDAMRRTIARRTTESFRDVPHFPILMKAEVDQLLAHKDRAGAAGAPVTLNDLLIKASALALVKVPAANASFTAKGLIFHNNADIAVAVATAGGLVTPIIRRVEDKSVVEISREMRDLAARAREKRLMPNEYIGGTFCISNLGMFGVTSFGSVINTPQGCILSVGAAEKQYVIRDDAPCIATVVELTLTCDHRVIDGAIGASWLQTFKRLLEAPETWADAVGRKP